MRLYAFFSRSAEFVEMVAYILLQIVDVEGLSSISGRIEEIVDDVKQKDEKS